jgi:hypothetical protein
VLLLPLGCWVSAKPATHLAVPELAGVWKAVKQQHSVVSASSAAPSNMHTDVDALCIDKHCAKCRDTLLAAAASAEEPARQ